MNFETSDEINAVRDSLKRMLAEHYTPAHRQALRDSDTAFAEKVWQELGGLGLTGLLVPQDFDGLGISFSDLLPVFLELGGSLAPVPFTSSSVLAVTALSVATDKKIQQQYLPLLAAGTLQVACPHTSASAVPPVSAQWRDGRWHLDGEQKHLPYAYSADMLVLVARTHGSDGDHDGLYMIDRKAAGVQLRCHRLIDGTPAADVRLDGVEATALCAPGEAHARKAITAMADAGIAAACAEMVGAMDAALGLTREHLGIRHQFGRAIGQNQALRHRVADMLVALEMARSLAIAAAVAAGEGLSVSAQGRADIHRAKFLVGRNAHDVCHAAIQLHGGIGMTEEYEVGHYLRRVHVLDHQFGDTAAHLRELTRSGN